MEKQIEVKQESNEQPEVERTRDCRMYAPRADIVAAEDQYQLVVDVPGADENSVDISLEKNVLTIHAHPVVERPEGYSPIYAEYGVGDYQRSFVLSEEIDRNQINAVVREGVLYLTLPKAKEARARKINVKAG